MNNHQPDYDDQFMKCYIAFGNYLRRYVYQLVRDKDVSEDIVHDVFIKLFEKKIPLNPEGETTRPFLSIVAKNQTYDYLRRQRMAEKKEKSSVVEELNITGQFYADVENAYIEGEVVSTIHDVLNELAEEKREIFIRRLMFGMRISEITEEMRVTAYIIRKVEKEVIQLIKTRVSRLL